MQYLIARIVFSGADGRILILPLIVLIYFLFGQVREIKAEIIKAFRKEGSYGKHNNLHCK